MSIRTVTLKDYPQQFDIPNDYKVQYGEVTTDFKLIKNILSLIPVSCFSNPDKKWLDPCCGRGYFMIYLYKMLFDGLESASSRGSGIVIVDTAGRLHTSSNLMSELDKNFTYNILYGK